MFVHSDAMTDLDIQELANLTAGDADVDNFERLFTKLKEMKGNWEMKNKHTTIQRQKTSFGFLYSYRCTLLSLLVW